MLLVRRYYVQPIQNFNFKNSSNKSFDETQELIFDDDLLYTPTVPNRIKFNQFSIKFFTFIDIAYFIFYL